MLVVLSDHAVGHLLGRCSPCSHTNRNLPAASGGAKFCIELDGASASRLTER